MFDKWIQELTTSNGAGNLQQVRHLMGDILKYLNHKSEVFKTSHRNPSEQTSATVKSFLAEINNGGLERLYSFLDHFRLNTVNASSNENKTLNRLLETIRQAKFSVHQIEMLRNNAHFDPGSHNAGFHEEANKAGLDKHLASSVYNLRDPQDRTLKVVREILQNGIDATDPEKHPHLQTRNGFKPEILIHTKGYASGGGSSENFMDISIEDKGVGMNWEMLSKKFFVTFESGKSQDLNAAGGFGIAKAIIQDSPEHGWAVDTNGVHSGRFHKNLYFGTPKNKEYHPQLSKVKKAEDGGLMISLFGLPYVDDSRIKHLCAIYGTNGRVKIVLNDEPVQPKFTLTSEDVKPLDDNLDALADVFTDSMEKEAANNVLAKSRNGIKDEISEIGDFSNFLTKINFFIRQVNKYEHGKLYVMVNGQYQFDKDSYINKIDIICSINTKARPGSDEYPLDPGRSYVRDPLGEKIAQVVKRISDFTEKVAENDLLKKGIDFSLANKDAAPMNTTNPKVKARMSELANALEAKLRNTMEEKTEEETVEEIKEIIKEMLPDNSPDATVQAVSQNLVKMRNAEMGSRVTVQDIERTIEGLEVPAAILIQKNYIAKAWHQKNFDVTSEMVIVWQKTLRIVLDKLLSSGRYGRRIREKPFIPGLIFSDECLGLYMSADHDNGRPYPTVSMNPVTLAAALNPKLFNARVNDESNEMFEALPEGADDEDSNKTSDTADTPTNRITKILFHIATHELCHLLFPDSWGHDEFHKNITYIEMLCHDAMESVRQVVKPLMKPMKANATRIINAIGKQRQKKMEHVISTFLEYIDSKAVEPSIGPHCFPMVGRSYGQWLRSKGL